jgi:hypothetical protein
MKLVSVVLPENKPASMRLSRHIDLRAPVDAVLGWRVLLRGPAVILLAPEGLGHEFARSACVLSWDSANPADYDKLQTYTSEPLARASQGAVA